MSLTVWPAQIGFEGVKIKKKRHKVGWVGKEINQGRVVGNMVNMIKYETFQELIQKYS